MAADFLLYGATGYTGRLLAHAARDRGMAPVLCGRSEDKLRALAGDLELEYRVAGLGDPAELARALDGVGVLLNAAGPFFQTAPALVNACLRKGVHYLDVTGEVPVIDMACQKSREARRRDVMLMPAVGFDVVATDCLAAHVAGRFPGAKHMYIGMSGLELRSRGSAKTYVESMGDPVWVRRRGALERVPPASLIRLFDFGEGPRSSAVFSWGDVASAYFTTGVPDITAYLEATDPVRAHHAMMLGLFGWTVPLTPWRAWLRASAPLWPEGPTKEEREHGQAAVVVEVEDDRGHVVRSRLRTPEAYSFTAMSAPSIASRVLAGDLEPGYQTPARVYGADFVLSLPGVYREDL
jgi:short subunit dehydrogenase-like uncharacterized protein